MSVQNAGSLGNAAKVERAEGDAAGSEEALRSSSHSSKLGSDQPPA